MVVLPVNNSNADMPVASLVWPQADTVNPVVANRRGASQSLPA